MRVDRDGTIPETAARHTVPSRRFFAADPVFSVYSIREISGFRVLPAADHGMAEQAKVTVEEGGWQPHSGM